MRWKASKPRAARHLQSLREQERNAADKRVQLRERELAAERQRAIDEALRIASDRAAQQQAQDREQLAEMKRQFAAAQEQNALLRQEQIALRDERQKLKDEKEALGLEVRRQVDAQLAQREAQVRAQEKENAALHNAELQKKLDDMTAQMAEMQRRAEQGSQQLQGEVLELALEEGLRRVFPLDAIEEVTQGPARRRRDPPGHRPQRQRRRRAALGDQARADLERRSGSPS